MSIAGFFLLLAQSIVLTIIGRKTVPLLMSEGKMKTILAGWLGGICGSLIDRFTWRLGPQMYEIYWGFAAGIAVLFVLALGLTPFIKILLRKN